MAALAGVASACASTPPNPTTALASAEAALGRGENAEALALLESVDEDDYAEEDLERYLVRKAEALARTGYLWDAFEIIRDFSEKHAFSPFDADVQDLEFEIGAELIQSDGGFLFFTSDKKDGQIVLEHFVLRYSKHPSDPDALRLLGEKAYAEGDYLLAGERFRELAVTHENSEWFELARFRIAMSSFKSLVGPRYDLRSMLRANNELRDFLARRVENPEFREEATASLKTVREWLGRKQVLISAFYLRINNSVGYRFHMRKAAADYPDTEAGAEAKVRVAQWDARGEKADG